MNFEDYASQDAVGLARLIRTKAVSAKEVTQAAIEAAEHLNPKLNALVMTNFETCCSTKQGCAVVEACLEKFSIDNKMMIAEQLLEIDSKENLEEFWTH